MPVTRSQPTTDFNAEQVRADFPTLARSVYDEQPLVYLDNAATSQKPQVVIDRLEQYYRRENSNVHRGVHRLSQDATDAYEGARSAVAKLINAPDTDQVIYTRGTTEAINLVAATYGRSHIGPDDEILISGMEHHSNIVPWQQCAEATGADLRIIPVTEHGELDLDAFEEKLTDRTKIVALVHLSNTLGTINPVETVIDRAHARDIPVLLDGAQAVPHFDVDVQRLDVDFYCFSGHKMFGPTGIGVLYGKREWLDQLPPYQGGGDMIDEVSFEKTTYAELPHKFEAGTPHIAGAIGLGAAARYLMDFDRAAITAYEDELLTYATDRVQALDGIRLIGTAEKKASVLSFLVDDAHPYDVGTILDRLGIAVRTGHHCTQPLMDQFDIPGTVRASFALYNTKADVDRLVEGLQRAQTIFG